MNKQLTINNILKFCGSSEARNFCEGEALANAKHVVLCGKTPSNDGFHHIYSLVLQTTALSSPPHEISGLIDKKSLLISKFFCSCKAGASECCKHVVAVLIYCSR